MKKTLLKSWMMSWMMSLMMGLLILLASCGGDDGGTPTPNPPSDAEILADGWAAFSAGDLDGAIEKFDDLVGRGVLLAEAHSGLGWSYSRNNNPAGALTDFGLALDETPTGTLADDVNAGLAFASNAAGAHTDCVTYSAAVSETWVFAPDPSVNHQDIIVLAAASHYYLGQFSLSLIEVQRLDATFTADVGTAAGRAELAAKIEELLGV